MAAWDAEELFWKSWFFCGVESAAVGHAAEQVGGGVGGPGSSGGATGWWTTACGTIVRAGETGGGSRGGDAD